MRCELCGNKDAINKTDIEGTFMNVCQDCSRFGKVKGRSNVRIVVQDKKRNEVQEPTYVFVPGFGRILKTAREKLGLKQDEMAKRLNEKESVLHQIESEHFKPNVVLARKLEKELHIKILEEIKEQESDSQDKHKTPGAGLTIADMMKVRR